MVSQIGRHSQWLMVRVVNNWQKESKGWRGRAREDVLYPHILSHSFTIIIIPKLPNLGSLEIRVSTYISAKLKKRTYMYNSLQFPVEINTRGSKTLTTFIPFHTKYDLQEQFWLFSHSYLQNGMLWLLNNFNILHDLKTDTFERCRHIYSFICMSLLTQ